MMLGDGMSRNSRLRVPPTRALLGAGGQARALLRDQPVQPDLCCGGKSQRSGVGRRALVGKGGCLGPSRDPQQHGLGMPSFVSSAPKMLFICFILKHFPF